MSTSSTPHGRILIGEDVGEIADGMVATLDEAGYEMHRATDGLECLRKARVILPDLLLLDIMMPKLHGVEVLRALRAEPATAGIGVIVCSAKDFKTDQAECEKLGVVGFLVKPFVAQQLLEIVNGYFSRETSTPSAPPPMVENKPSPFCPKLDTSTGVMSLWGTRGSTPTPGARFLRHGGNTACMSIAYRGEHYIFDAGSGLRDLGMALLNGPARKLNLFITHTHWDHIQGFPFFTPAYLPGFEIAIWGASGFGKDLESIFRGQLDRDYFPVQMDDMKSVLHFHHLQPHPVKVNDVTISWEYVQHPGATVGYKINVGGFRVAWIPDNEFLQGYTGPPEDLTRDHPLVAPYRKIIDFVSDVDVLIHEAQYTNDEYPAKVGWGHCGLSNACALMKLANVPRWLVTHHDPSHDDDFLENKMSMTRQLLARLGHDMDVEHGHDGLVQIL